MSRLSGALCLGLIAGLYAPAAASAEPTAHVTAVEAHLLAFSKDGPFFAYATESEDLGATFVIAELDKAEAVHTEHCDDRPCSAILKRHAATYALTDPGKSGASSPSGTSKVSAEAKGSAITVTLHQGDEAKTLGTVARLDDGAGTTASFKLKEVIWKSDETAVVVIAHQELRGDWPMHLDTVHGFKVPVES